MSQSVSVGVHPQLPLWKKFWDSLYDTEGLTACCTVGFQAYLHIFSCLSDQPEKRLCAIQKWSQTICYLSPCFFYSPRLGHRREKRRNECSSRHSQSLHLVRRASEITGKCMCWSRDTLAPTLFPACVSWDLYTLITINFNILIQVLKHNNQENTNANICKTQCRRLK